MFNYLAAFTNAICKQQLLLREGVCVTFCQIVPSCQTVELEIQFGMTQTSRQGRKKKFTVQLINWKTMRCTLTYRYIVVGRWSEEHYGSVGGQEPFRGAVACQANTRISRSMFTIPYTMLQLVTTTICLPLLFANNPKRYTLVATIAVTHTWLILF